MAARQARSPAPCFYKHYGYLSIHSNVSDNLITDLYVINECRRIGVGKKLLKSALNEFKKNNSNNFLLWVANNNVAAIRLYTSLGFIKGNKHIKRENEGQELILELYSKS